MANDERTDIAGSAGRAEIRAYDRPKYGGFLAYRRDVVTMPDPPLPCVEK
jgi:hypothetical protein